MCKDRRLEPLCLLLVNIQYTWTEYTSCIQQTYMHQTGSGIFKEGMEHTVLLCKLNIFHI